GGAASPAASPSGSAAEQQRNPCHNDEQPGEPEGVAGGDPGQRQVALHRRVKQGAPSQEERDEAENVHGMAVLVVERALPSGPDPAPILLIPDECRAPNSSGIFTVAAAIR